MGSQYSFWKSAERWLDLRPIRALFRLLTSPFRFFYRAIRTLLRGVRLGVAGILVLGGWGVVAVVDLIAIFRCFTEHSMFWWILSLTPPGWLIIPFKTGLGTYFVLGCVAGLVGGMIGPRD